MDEKEIKRLEELGKQKWGRLFTCPYCERRHYVYHVQGLRFRCASCGFEFTVPEEILRKIAEEIEEDET